MGGHPGGIATVHANSARLALYRIEQLIQATVPRHLLADAIDLVVFISGRGSARRIDSIARLIGVDPDGGGYALVDLLALDRPQGV